MPMMQAYTAKKNGRNAWVGVYGTRKSSWEDFASANVDLVSLAARGHILLTTSLVSLSEAVEAKQQKKLQKPAV